MFEFLIGYFGGVLTSALIAVVAMTCAVMDRKKQMPSGKIWGFSEGPQATYDLSGYDGKKPPLWRRLFAKPIE